MKLLPVLCIEWTNRGGASKQQPEIVPFPYKYQTANNQYLGKQTGLVFVTTGIFLKFTSLLHINNHNTCT